MTAGKEHVAIFNPLVLPLPSWHPDGPDGKIDGFVIPFVFPDNRPSGRTPNRAAKIAVTPNEHGDWRAALRNCQDHAETAEQARAFAAAWIRAAEVLDSVGANEVVDAEVIEDDDEDQRGAGGGLAEGHRVRITGGLGPGDVGRQGEVTNVGAGESSNWVEVLLDLAPGDVVSPVVSVERHHVEVLG